MRKFINVRYIVCIILLISLYSSVQPLNITSSTGISASYLRELTTYSVAEADSYIDSNSPSSNYGGQNYIRAGYFLGDTYEIFLTFNFTNRPANWNKAEISLDCYYTTETQTMEVYLITDPWEEYVINYSNAPSSSEKITEILITGSEYYYIDVTEYIPDLTNEISILITPKYVVDGFCSFYSREMSYSSMIPIIIWTFEADAGFEITKPLTGVEVTAGDYLDIEYSFETAGALPFPSYVNISLYKGAQLLYTMYSYIQNDGNYQGKIKSNVPPGSDYRIKISDYYHPNEYTFSEYFTVLEPTIPGYSTLMVITLLIGVSILMTNLTKKKIIRK